MPGLKSEKRAEIKRMLAQGLHPAEIAAALGIPRSTVTYYAGPVREPEPVPDTPVIPGAAPVPDVHVIPSPDAPRPYPFTIFSQATPSFSVGRSGRFLWR